MDLGVALAFVLMEEFIVGRLNFVVIVERFVRAIRLRV